MRTKEHIVKQLESLLIGRFVEGSECNCGCIKLEDAKVIGVTPPTEQRNIIYSIFYEINVKGVKTGQRYSVTPSIIASEEEIEQIFGVEEK